MSSGVPWLVIFAISAVVLLAASLRRPRRCNGCDRRREETAAAGKRAEADTVMALADAVREDHGEPLTGRDRQLLDHITGEWRHLDPEWIERGRQIADLLRVTCPSAADAWLSRGILRTAHIVAWIGEETGETMSYGQVVAELAIAAHDLTALERAETLP